MAPSSSGTCHMSHKTSGREGRRTTSVSDHLGDRTGSGSGYLSNSGTRSPPCSSKVPIVNGERGSSP
ncbi:unnamed protein product [Staurois parvus]|uniref:Uncharacterized protein n=1 Tax=Staurois parvus TaxID=386267 RepID=A0ABN9FLA4_9NEOB|nr:unnamed protein product [Staurois parvus]